MNPLDRRVLTALLPLLLVVYLLTMAGRLTSGDGETVYQTTRALVTRLSLEVPNRPETALGRNGNFYGKYGLGQSIAQAPFVIAGELARKAFHAVDDRPARFAAGMTNNVVTVLLAGLFWLSCRALGAGRRLATVITLILALGTLVWPYARADFAEPLQSLTLLGAFYALVRWRRAPSVRWSIAAGAAAGAAFLTKAASAVVMPGLALYFCLALWEHRHRGLPALARHAVGAGAPLALCVLFQASLNVYRFGRPGEFGYGDEPAVGFITPVFTGIQYLLFSTGKGLFFFAPPVIAGLALLPLLARRYRAEAAVIVLVFLCELLYFARWWAWHGDWSWGTRYLVLTVPFLMLGWCALASMRPHAFVKGALSLLAAAGVAVSFLGVVVDYGNYYSVVETQIGRGVDMDEARLVPTFSPILGHAWLTRATLHDTIAAVRSGDAPRDPRQNPALAQHPWAGSHPGLAPTAPERALGFDLWFVALRNRSPFTAFWSALAAAWLALALIPLSAALFRALRAEPSGHPESVLDTTARVVNSRSMGTVPAWPR